ncbi:MAG: GMC family oxidoreductase N-terminal domain-containing protein, partial [Burkholderiales bacterium]|nr:GMC family oxidoreductase N-terminal domain-containing protein [Burkholderiales bacterium]
AWAENSPAFDTSQTPHFDVLIIGSGYGGAVAAARFAGAQENKRELNIAVLERGREILPGDFPNNFAQLVGDLRISRHNNDKLTGNAEALFDLRVNETVNVLLGNGLGGGSLINAAVAEAPHPAVWNNARWPKELKNEAHISPYLERARQFLGTGKIDDCGAEEPIKLRSMKRLSEAIEGDHYRTVDIAIDLNRCVQCGDCVTGCNFNAKNTLPKTYLAHAKKNGAKLYTGATVSHIRKLTHTSENGDINTEWLVYFVLTYAKGHPSQQQVWVIKTRHLVLSAGALGSTEILQRSAAQDETLIFSNALGKNFSCNGDMIWSGYDQDTKVNAMADPEQKIDQRKVGPTIASMIDLRQPHTAIAGETPHVIQDASIPAALKRVFEEIVTSNAVSYRMIKQDKEDRSPWQDVDAVNPDKMQRTATYLSMGLDQASGELKFKLDTPKSNTGIQGKSIIHWGDEDKKSPLPEDETDNVCNDPVYTAAEKSLQRVDSLGGTLLPSPNYRIGPKDLLEQLSGTRALKSTLTVHPLGGCSMGDHALSGVVNHYGAVFDAHTQFALHEGLYVLDGSVVPCALGINPLLSILGLAERAIEFIAQDEDWDLRTLASKPAPANYDIQEKKLEPVQSEKLGFTFQEVMNFEPEEDGEQKNILTEAGLSHVKNMRLIVEFHIQEKNLAAFLRNPKRTVAISESRLQVAFTNGDNEEYKLTGNVHWLWESSHTTDQKEKHGFTRYLRHRAQADLVTRKDLSVLMKLVLHYAIAFLNKFNIVLPSFFNRLLRFSSRLSKLLNLSTHTGGHRLLRYQLQSDDGKIQLKGLKDANYGDGSNLWRSLSQLNVKLQYLNKQVNGLHFRLDWNEIFEANSFQIDPPAEGVPRNPDVWLDIFSIFSFWARALGRIHFWSFRLPEVQTEKRHPRLPSLAIAPNSQWYPLLQIDRRGNAFHIGLTHFPAANPHGQLPPLLMIHGFGASGLQFAAPGNQTSMVEHFLTEGRDVWVAELRTSIAMNRELDDKLAQWSMDEVAKHDIPVLVAEVLKQTSARQVDILAHCIGSAMFNIAVLAGKLMQEDGVTPLIRRSALLQVGPIFSVSENNKLRGYVAYFAGRSFDVDFVDSSTDFDSEDATNSLVDRMLATYPVPLTELRDDEEEKSLFPVYPNNQWQANYYRSSGVFGRLFSLHQLSPEMLNQLGDLLGRTNFKTFQQIIHCVMRNRLVDTDGRNCYVTADNFRQFYNFPTRFFYGEKNDVFAQSGVVHSVAQLRSTHGWAENLEHACDDSPYSYQIFPKFGHLDPIIGINAARDVYPELSAFLNADQSSFSHGQVSERLYIRKPIYGPVIGWTRKTSTNIWVSRVWICARETAGRPLYAMVYRHSIERGVYDLKLLPIQDLLRFQYIAIDVHLKSADETIYISCLHQGSQEGSGTQFNEISCINFDQLKQNHETIRPRPLKKDTQRVPSPDDVLSEIVHFDDDQQTSLEEHLQSKINALPPYKIAEPPCRNAKARPYIRIENTKTSRLALGSCRYSGTELEQVRSNAAYDALLNRLDTNTSPELMLLMGDQVYVDATAGVADPSDIASIVSLYHRSLAQRYNNKFFAAAQVFSRLPAYMMLDDHEISDNWNSNDVSFDTHEQERCEMAIAAFLSHQWSHGPRNDMGYPHYWTSFDTGQINFFMLDTRLERTPAQPGYPNQIISDAQFAALGKWLNDTHHGGKLRLIISPSQLHNLEDEHVLRGDAWSAYPNCLARLATLLENQRHVGILCGDQHLHGLYSLDYHDATGGLTRHIPIIVASPLYAPYPFANPRNDIIPNTSAVLSTHNKNFELRYRLLASNASYQGFSQLVVEKIDNIWHAGIFEIDGIKPLFGTRSSIQF